MKKRKSGRDKKEKKEERKERGRKCFGKKKSGEEKLIKYYY